jgi:AraC-like DNA-binding protein
MVEQTRTRSDRGQARRFTADDFRVPAGYLPLLVGAESASELLGHVQPPGDVLPSVQFLNLCLEHMRRTGDEAYGSTPAKVARGTFGLLIAAAAQGDTFAEGLRRFAAAAPMLRPDLTVKFTRSRRGLSLSIDHAGEPDPRRDMIVEIFAITMHCGFRWLTGRKLSPVLLRVAPPRPPLGPTLLWPVISPNVERRGRGVTLVYDPDDAGVALKPVKYRHWGAQELVEFTALLDEAARALTGPGAPPPTDIIALVTAVIGPESRGEPAAARRLGMSTATLRRRLSEAGVTFRQLSSDTRRAAAARLLASTDQSMEEVAAQLGLSDARSLRRACNGWFGMSPADYRRQGAGSGGVPASSD